MKVAGKSTLLLICCFLLVIFEYSVRFRVLSWNIDGLDQRNTVERAKAVCCFIQAKIPHVVYLQEVVDATWAEIVKSLSNIYDCYSPPSCANYFIAILVHKKSVVTTGELKCLDFSSHMGRQLLQLPIRFAGTDIYLMTSHLESTSECAKVRKEQLTTVFELMSQICTVNSGTYCLFGGDLNLRDKELRDIAMPPGIVDIWEGCGSPPDEKYTWDIQNNDNLDWPYRNKPRCRFDRLYLMPESRRGLRIPADDSEGKRFVLVGKVRLSKCGGMFPSDHWGMSAELEVPYE